MSPRPDLLVLAAEIEAHLVRAEREAASIEELSGGGARDKRTLWALAGHLQAFYTGCETILARALEKFEGLPPVGPDTHIRILQAAALDVSGVRPRVLGPQSVSALHPYRGFRHFFRHAYGVELVWEKMAAKVRDVRVTFDGFRSDVGIFCAFLRSAANA